MALITYQQVDALATDQAFTKAAYAGFIAAALDICSESTTSPGHVARATLARQVFGSSGLWVSLCEAMALGATSTDVPADQALYNRAASIWNAFAGV